MRSEARKDFSLCLETLFKFYDYIKLSVCCIHIDVTSNLYWYDIDGVICVKWYVRSSSTEASILNLSKASLFLRPRFTSVHNVARKCYNYLQPVQYNVCRSKKKQTALIFLEFVFLVEIIILYQIYSFICQLLETYLSLIYIYLYIFWYIQSKPEYYTCILTVISGYMDIWALVLY